MLLILGAGGYSVWRRHVGPGPLDGENTLDYSHHIAVGERFSFGGALITNDTKKPARIERVRVLGVTDGLEVLGVRTRQVPDGPGPGRVNGMFLGALDYPPSEYATRPLAEQNIVPVATSRTPSGDPENGLELVIGVRATRPGIARLRGVEFTYRLGGRRYRGVSKGFLYLCAPVGAHGQDQCPGEAEGHFSDIHVEAKSG